MVGTAAYSNSLCRTKRNLEDIKFNALLHMGTLRPRAAMGLPSGNQRVRCPPRTLMIVSEISPEGWIKPGTEMRVKAGAKAEDKRREHTQGEGSREEGHPGFSFIALKSKRDCFGCEVKVTITENLSCCQLQKPSLVQRQMLSSGTRGLSRKTELLPNL